MAKKNSSSVPKELLELITNYETAKANNRQLYMDGDQLADIADWYATEQRFAEAQEVIDYGFHLHPGNTDLLIQQAYLYLDLHQLQDAKDTVATISEEYSPEVKMLKAELLLNEEKPEEACQLLETIAADIDLDTLVEIVHLFLDLRYPQYALEWLEKGKSRYAEEEEYQALTADSLLAAHELDAAIEVYNKLIDKSPYNTAYWMGLAKIYFIKENIEKSVEACDFALAADETYGEAYAYRAHNYFYLNNPDAAIADYQKAIDYKAIPPMLGYMFMGLSYANKEEWEKAADCYTRVIECFKEEDDENSILLIDTYTSKAAVVSQLGRFNEAHQLCDKAKEIDPDDSHIYLTDGKVYLEEGKKDKAAKAFEKAMELNPDVDMCHMVASAYSENEYLHEAKTYYEMAYKIDPQYDQVADKLSILSLVIDNDVEKFIKYNNESQHPLGEDVISGWIAKDGHNEEEKQMLVELLRRIKEEKNKKENNNQF